MKDTYKYYIPCHGYRKVNALKVSVYYSKGGFSYWTYKTEPRGYFLSVTPVEHNDIMEGCILGDGCKLLLAEASRYSDKGFDNAVAMHKDHLQDLIAYNVNHYGIILDDTAFND